MSFQKMRRSKRNLSTEDCHKIIQSNNCGILSLNNINGYPYGIPLNYTYHNDALYFHCAAEGKKLNLIKNNAKICYAIIGKNEIIPEEFANEYQSVIIFGNAKIIENKTEKKEILHHLCADLGCKNPKHTEDYINSKIDFCTVIKLCIDHISGKARTQESE